MRSLSLLLAHLAANAILLGLGYYWLGVPESWASTLAWSASIAVAILLFAAWTYGADFVFFQQATDRGAVDAWRGGLRNIIPFAAAIVAIVLLYWALAQWGDYSAKPAFRIASWLTLKLRTPVRPASVARTFNGALWLVRWIILPVIFLPMLSAITKRGWRGFASPGPRGQRWAYWIETPILLYCAVRAPLLLLHWVPHVTGFGMEAASFVVRAAIAYLLFGCALLLLALVTAIGSPRVTQPSTVVSP